MLDAALALQHGQCKECCNHRRSGGTRGCRVPAAHVCFGLSHLLFDPAWTMSQFKVQRRWQPDEAGMNSHRAAPWWPLWTFCCCHVWSEALLLCFSASSSEPEMEGVCLNPSLLHHSSDHLIQFLIQFYVVGVFF